MTKRVITIIIGYTHNQLIMAQPRFFFFCSGFYTVPLWFALQAGFTLPMYIPVVFSCTGSFSISGFCSVPFAFLQTFRFFFVPSIFHFHQLI
jgi:hypothetical protein